MAADPDDVLLAKIRQAFIDLLLYIQYSPSTDQTAARIRLHDVEAWLAKCSEPGISLETLRPMLLSLKDLLPDIARTAVPAAAAKVKRLQELVNEALERLARAGD